MRRIISEPFFVRAFHIMAMFLYATLFCISVFITGVNREDRVGFVILVRLICKFDRRVLVTGLSVLVGVLFVQSTVKGIYRDVWDKEKVPIEKIRVVDDSIFFNGSEGIGRMASEAANKMDGLRVRSVEGKWNRRTVIFLPKLWKPIHNSVQTPRPICRGVSIN